MVYRRLVQKGVVVLEDPKALADGTEVSVRPVKGKRTPGAKKKKKPSVSAELLQMAGMLDNLPPDASQNVDHYLYGHPKQ